MPDPLAYLTTEIKREIRRLNAAHRAGDITELVHGWLVDQLHFVQARITIAQHMNRP